MQDVKRNRRIEETEEERALNGKRHKRKRRGAAVRLYIMVLFFMLTIGVVLIFTVFFKVAQIEVVGLTRYGEEEVIASSGIAPEMNMFRLNRSGISTNLVREYSYFEEVRLKFTLPDTVTIQVMEAEPAGAIKQGEGYLLFSQAGRVLETGVAAPPKNLPVVKGLSDSLALAAGQQLGYTDEARLASLQETIATLQKKIAGSKAGEKVLAEKQAELDGYQKQADIITTELSARTERLKTLYAFLAVRKELGFAGVTAIDLTDANNLVVNCGTKVELQLGTLAELAVKLGMAQRVLTQELGPDFEGRIDVSFPGKAYVAAMDLTVANMTADEYAQYLYESASVPQPASSAPESAPKQSSSAAQAPAAPASSAPEETEDGVILGVEEEPGTQTPAEEQEENATAPPAEDEFVAGVEE